MRLDRFDARGLDRGAPAWAEALWLAVSALLVSSWLPGSSWRVWLLRMFGAQMGRGVVVKPGVRVKFPWRLVVGDYSWIGESVWIDNLAPVFIGSHVCVSQGTYLCTGSHDWGREGFDLIVRSITLSDRVWIGAGSVLAPGCICDEGAVLLMGSVAKGQLASWTIHAGNPAQAVQARPVLMPRGF